MNPFQFRLRPQVSCCTVGARLVFLDLSRDRYVCLTGPAEQSVRRCASGAPPCTGDESLLMDLVEDGLLERSSTASELPLECRIPAVPAQSLLERDCRASRLSLAHACLRMASSLAAFRVLPLARNLARLAARKTRTGDRAGAVQPALIETVAAFRSAQLLFAPLDRCLPHSLAIAHALIDRGIRPDLVIGVKLRPFAAHCWVQHGDVLLNDTIDHVRTLTPILVA
jgi:hypothetical protein